ncbi:MAG: glycerol-3-phosphate dehydrogenase [Rhodospirillales bacterium]|nr:glycerol-3-phosphate dehydrogenase [Rhodospirillales bacterium]MSP80429.1 glycerol-3-phosphate dehydrogenase [Rhodospirillales bacterium]
MPDSTPFDLLVVGGGINGAGIARDAAGRGLKTLLVEQADLAQATSSASSKLIHGGLRYLEHYQFRLVRESLQERDTLLAIAPHIVHALSFVLPHPPDAPRPAWLVRLGLLLYDVFALESRLPRSRKLDLRHHAWGAPLGESLVQGFSYSDCWVDDARLVVGNAMDAARRGASILTRTRFVRAVREGNFWQAILRDEDSREYAVAARALVNAAGPWAADVLKDAGSARTEKNLRLVKGSHIVVPAHEPLPAAYILQNTDRRVVFVIPFADRFNLIGTTDVPYQGDPAQATCSAEEAEYLCAAVALYFRRPPKPSDAVWSFAGVRPLLDDDEADPAKITRDYALEVEGGNGEPPVLTVFGGKLTTYRRLAEKVLARLAPWFPDLRRAWTATVPLPGGDFQGRTPDDIFADLARDYPGIERDVLRGIFRRHGTLVRDVLGDARSPADLGIGFGGGLFARETAYLKAHEWARTPEDILWRRTKCGLAMTEVERRIFVENFK